MKLLPFYILFFFLSVAFGQSEEEVLSEDSTSKLVERKLSDDLNEKYQGEEFNYEVKTGEAQNLLARFFNWLGRLLQNTFGINIPPGAFKVLEIIVYVLMGALAVFLLIRILINEKFNSIFTKKAKSIIDINLSEQHIENIDLDKLLNDALEQKEYRLAIRYHFLKVLKLLSEKNLIDWHFEKTNSDYLKEIKGEHLKSGFQEASRMYDYVWYGERPLNEQNYDWAAERFTSLNTLIPNNG